MCRVRILGWLALSLFAGCSVQAPHHGQSLRDAQPPNSREGPPLNDQASLPKPSLRILYIEGPPRYGYRFLKNALIRDSALLVHCWLTSADDGFAQEHTASEDPFFAEPLKKFPADLQALLNYDVIIYGDVDPSRLGPNAGEHLLQFVRDHGRGLVFLSGMMHLRSGLRNAPLLDLLPVVPKIPDPADQEKIHDHPVGYRLTAEGMKSPLTNFDEFKGDRDRNLEHWEDRDGRGDGLVSLRWSQEVSKLKTGAIVLVNVTNMPGASSTSPLFVIKNLGKGRVFWSGTDETWLWRYMVGDQPWFYPFWQSVIDWAAAQSAD